jgi:hypothetical protein
VTPAPLLAVVVSPLAGHRGPLVALLVLAGDAGGCLDGGVGVANEAALGECLHAELHPCGANLALVKSSE